ncbi:MAG: pyruvate-flavodoxin oxidoreductase [Candidatus Paraimprobicoccus trichonymphae]|uniref:Pyruvate:ferredoxin oxidoreductase n=1 Tax=Candidatus Paraimprobicoccus trichonymphae TaxID=3033793 RepID=A0AA48IBD3_9FIRM|nr:MAG: pyruvate-flavodoxin oxidoreductase [Candidatus Paraimprobicoccus trichonymphae]
MAFIYPITPSSEMANQVDKFTYLEKKNIFDNTVVVRQMQSEGGVAGAMHGALSSGVLSNTYTASQGLLLMIPNMYKIAGELLPNVIHVSSRTIGTHALSIFGDHSDIYACRQTGYAMICSNNPQEALDLGLVSHLSSIKSRIPILHFFDGFRTSHEIQKIKLWDYSELKDLLDFESVKEFKKRALSPENPVIRGTAQNDDVFFQAREACNKYYANFPKVVKNYMNKINKKSGCKYDLFNYYGNFQAERIIVAMGSVCNTIEEVINYLIKKDQKVGLIKVRLYRPFVSNYLKKVLPESVKKITVLDRTKECGSIGEPLFLDVLGALNELNLKNIKVYSGRYGLSSKDTTPSQILAVFDNMRNKNLKKRFTIGIKDDVTNLSLSAKKKVDTTPKDIFCCKLWGLGADGTVGANKNTIKIIGNNTNLQVQGYFSYDSKKSGGVTVSNLRFGRSKIKSSYLINKADFVACHNMSYIFKYDIVQDVKKNGSFLLNTTWSENELEKKLPDEIKLYLYKNKINLYIINAFEISKNLGLNNKINTVLQASFFKITDIIDINLAEKLVKKYIYKSYIKKGEEIVNLNYKAVEAGIEKLIKINIPKSWGNIKLKKNIKNKAEMKNGLEKYVNNILVPVSNLKGNDLHVSKFLDYVDGTFPTGSTKYEKRTISLEIPEWIPQNCIQCNICSFVCPHAVIRPVVLDSQENIPENFKYKNLTGFDNLNYSVVVSSFDCTGCGICEQVCPNKAIKIKTFSDLEYSQSQNNFNFGINLPEKSEIFEKFKINTVKGSQFKQPLLEFSGACAGCGETPYAKLVTQLFGERLYISNSTGCSSIWGGSFPSCPYTVNKNNKGPAWQNSLFEDNAEFGYGICLANKTLRKNLIYYINIINNITEDKNLKILCADYLKSINNGNLNYVISEDLINYLSENLELLENKTKNLAEKILENKKYLSKKSFWIFGGDGWAYDIGFGGLDHVIASGEDINILVLDTEVYSNTGGQASKATQIGAIAQFSCFGKSTFKKDLSKIFMTYENVYVAQVSMGANYNQCVKAFTEAENFNGPSLIVAYSTCIAHGIKFGMKSAKLEEKKAVESGYFNLFRYNSKLKEFNLDSKNINLEKYKGFLKNETRYNYLEKIFPKRAKELYEKSQNFAEQKYLDLKKL